MGLFGPPNINKMIYKRDVKGLIKLLKSSRAGAAADALGQVAQHPLPGAPDAVEPLIAVLTGTIDEDTRKAAAWALGWYHDARAVGPLIAALKDMNQAVRNKAAEALGRIRDVRAVGPLSATLKLSNQEHGVFTVDATVATEALGDIGAPAVEALIAALKGGDTYEKRSAAAKALGYIGDARAVEPLIVELKFENKSAAAALGKIGAPAINPLILTLLDGRQGVRNNAVSLLTQLGWKPGRDENGARYWIASNNWKECAAIGASAVELLVAVLNESDKYEIYNNSPRAPFAANALGEIGARLKDPLLRMRVIEALIAKLKDADLCKVAFDGLTKIGAYNKDAVIQARMAEPLVDVLKDVNVKHLRRPKDGDINRRWWAVEALAKLGDAHAVEPLIAALESENRQRRIDSAGILVKLYHSGNLDAQNKQSILAFRSKITEPHHDESWQSYCETSYETNHTDEGIAVDFPL